MVKTLFNQHATARRDDAVSSHAEADKLNADNHRILNRQLTIVLRAVQLWPGRTAHQLDSPVCSLGGCYGWAWRRMSQLVESGYVRREQIGNLELRCYITEAGRKALAN